MVLKRKMQTGGQTTPTTEEKVESLVTEQAGIGDTDASLPKDTVVNPVLLQESTNEVLAQQALGSDPSTPTAQAPTTGLEVAVPQSASATTYEAYALPNTPEAEAARGTLNSKNPSANDGISMFTKWIAHSYYSEDMDIVGIIETFGRITLSEEERRAYEAPYPNGKYKAGAHVWPYLIPTQLQENEKYWKEVLDKWEKPFLVAFGGEERITLRMKDDFTNRIPNPTVITLGGAGHFVQEEVGPELAQIIIDFVEGREVTDLVASRN